MSTDYLIFLSVPGLRPTDVDREVTPTLHGWANKGALAELEPSFPCLTSSVQASMWTGTPPNEHGVIANGSYCRDRHEVEFWVARNDIIESEQVWDALRSKRPDYTSAVWHAQNIKGAGTDFIVTPAPIHEPDGTTKLWCYSKPDGLYQQLLDDLGHFPLQHYWGPLASIESTRWILSGASWLIEEHAPNFHWIYVPHLDYAAQKFGPNSDQARNALAELDRELAVFAKRAEASRIGDNAVFLVAGEYALTDVSSVVYPNRLLRESGLLVVEDRDGTEFLDLEASQAFAMVDHQVAHVYVNSTDPDVLSKCADLFRGVDGIAGVYVGDERSPVGVDHRRSGEVVLVADGSCWFAYYWWLYDRAAPPFARTVDIHQKPGYDPVELFFDPKTKSIPLEASLVKGSHGAPAKAPCQHGALICSAQADAVLPGATYRDLDVMRMTLDLLGV